MKLRVSRRNVLVTGIATLLLSSVAWSSEQHVITLATESSTVIPGQNVAATIGVNEGSLNVNVVSNPPGLVNQTVSASGSSATANLSTNPNAPAGSYQIIATPVGGGGSYVQTVAVK